MSRPTHREHTRAELVVTADAPGIGPEANTPVGRAGEAKPSVLGGAVPIEQLYDHLDEVRGLISEGLARLVVSVNPWGIEYLVEPYGDALRERLRAARPD